ncbi:MAG TPA: c-type cytochrome [Burkholderiaceae bacterium]|jgi:cytochrome c553|nr:c-type cytochrome [Burkholderiaceae bacterium]
MSTEQNFSWKSPWVRWSVLALVALTIASLLVGFVWLPSQKADFAADGLWSAICRAAGVPASWSRSASSHEARGTQVVLDRRMTRADDAVAIGRGATLALNCTMCHGALGASTSNAPNLAGQYPEVIVKQLRDYAGGARASSIMQAMARNLNERDIDDLAAYYASLPKARTAPTTYDESLPRLVRVGDPMRNIPPCIACHGQVDQKIGAPWLEGMPRAYLAGQLAAFRSGQRRNDGEAQMRDVARGMSDDEIAEVSNFYARKAVSY